MQKIFKIFFNIVNIYSDFYQSYGSICSGERCGLWASCLDTVMAERNCTYFSSLQLLKVFLEFAKRQLDENVTDENVDNEQNSLEQSLRRRTSSRDQGKSSSQGSANVVWRTALSVIQQVLCVSMVYLIAVLHLKPFGLTYLNIVCRKGISSEGCEYMYCIFLFFFDRIHLWVILMHFIFNMHIQFRYKYNLSGLRLVPTWVTSSLLIRSPYTVLKICHYHYWIVTE